MCNVLEHHCITVNFINEEYQSLSILSNDELRSKLYEIEKKINFNTKKLDKYLVQVYAIVKETARRFSKGDILVTANDRDRFLASKYDFLRIEGDVAVYKNQWDVCGNQTRWDMIHYDEQLLGGILLHYGYATEMATGEGKTLVATLPVFLNALAHKGVHLMTVNDYLSKRDFETTRPIYMLYGLTADCIEYYGRDDNRRKVAYKQDITFGKTSTFTFDYLFDHIATIPEDCVQQNHNFAIIDELDSILIDEANSSHIIGGNQYYNDGDIYKKNISIIRELLEYKGKRLFKADSLSEFASFTRDGKKWLSDKVEIPDLYEVEKLYDIADFENLDKEEQRKIKGKLHLQNVFLQLLKALTICVRDEDYIVQDDKVLIIDANTGRPKGGNRWSYGLHTAVEVKEGVTVQDDFSSIAVISLKNYFRLYNKVAGMSGTIIPIADELFKTYKLKSAILPTHRPIIRVDEPLRVFKTLEEKYNAILQTILNNYKKGRPTLVGCASIKNADKICKKLDEYNISYNKLDAKTVAGESLVISKAGIGNTITISTSIAGRGTDIKPTKDALRNGGLMVIGVDLFDSQRIDRQLQGRSGRQGNPGSSVFFASLEDKILKNLSTKDFRALKNLSNKFTKSEISYPEIRSYFEKAQVNKEKTNLKCRKSTARKDDIIAPRRRKFYTQRNSVLFSSEAAEDIVKDLLIKTNTNSKKVEEHLSQLYAKIKQLFIRRRRNDSITETEYIPFSCNLQTFAISLNISEIINSYLVFCKEFKRQIILHTYDIKWKEFVLYMMGNLDKKEIMMLDGRYNNMLNEIEITILDRLLYSTIPFNIKDDDVFSETPSPSNQKNEGLQKSAMIRENDLCPCGSNKKFCECHGKQSTRRIQRRR